MLLLTVENFKKKNVAKLLGHPVDSSNRGMRKNETNRNIACAHSNESKMMKRENRKKQKYISLCH